MINVLRFARSYILLWFFVAWAVALAAPVQSQGMKATEMAEIISHVRATGKSDDKKFVYSFFAKALGLGNAAIPGVKRRGVSFGEDPRVYLFDIADQPSGTILLMYKYDPASGTIVWRVNPAGNVTGGAYITGHPAKYKPGQPVTKFSDPKFHADFVETKEALFTAARQKPAEQKK